MTMKSGDNIVGESFPELLEYLTKSDTILDLGCGHGMLTIDVARTAWEGNVIGIDKSEENISIAQKNMRESGVSNVRFVFCDGLNMPYEDEVFDLAYSNKVFEWARDPISLLREQKRVVKKNGWVINTFSELGTQVYYPPCPTIEKIIAASRKMLEYETLDFHYNGFLGRKSVELYSKVGFRDIKINGSIRSWSLQYQKKGNINKMQKVGRAGRYDKFAEAAVCANLLVKEDIVQAEKEYVSWTRHPDAFFMTVIVVAAGLI